MLFEAMGKLPKSGDAELDALLEEACKKFRDPARPAHRKSQSNGLRDAWERLKTLNDASNKRASAALLLASASGHS